MLVPLKKEGEGELVKEVLTRKYELYFPSQGKKEKAKKANAHGALASHHLSPLTTSNHLSHLSSLCHLTAFPLTLTLSRVAARSLRSSA